MTATFKLRAQTVKERPLSYLTRTIHPSDVNDPPTFAAYAQQTCGIPGPRNKNEWGVLRHQCKEFFEQHPEATWMTVVHLTDWCRARKKRLAHTHSILSMVRYAWSDRALPELDPRDRVNAEVERGLLAALEVEQDPEWRRVLIGCKGERARKAALEQWRKKQSLLSR